MGNRASITTKAHKTSVYLHWNGGRDSVDRFLAYCASTGCPSPEEDLSGWAQLATCAANYFGPDGLNVGLEEYPSCDEDNGVYVIENWKVVCRENNRYGEQAEGPSTPSEGELAKVNRAKPKTPANGEKESIYVTSPWPLARDKICLQITSEHPLLDLVAVCAYCDELGFGMRKEGDDYGYARLAQILTNYLGYDNVKVGNYSDFAEDMAWCDREQVVTVGWPERSHRSYIGMMRERPKLEITDSCGGRYLDTPGVLDLQVNSDGILVDKLCEIAASMPDSVRIPESYLRAEKVHVTRLMPGDVVSIVPELNHGDAPTEEHVVLGLGADRICNGDHVAGVPIIDAFEYRDLLWSEARPELPDPGNPNNYLHGAVYRVVGHAPDDPRIPKMAEAIEEDYQRYLNPKPSTWAY